MTPEVGTGLGKALRAAGYGGDGLRAAIGAPAWGGPNRVPPSSGDVPVVARRLSPDAPAAVLFRLFLLGDAVPEDEAAAPLLPLTVEALVDARVLVRQSGAVRSCVRIGWCDDVLVASDWDGEGLPPADHVAPVAPASLTLANLTVRAQGVDVLDMGTGCGVQAFLAAGHARSVVGTDLNERALALSAFGAALNGLASCAWRQGSFFDPVAGERFDLVAANPPFVISPEAAFMFRDGGGVGDSVSRRVVADAARALRPGGWATILCSWVERGDDWSAPVAQWLDGTGCDAWILRHRSDDPVTYAGVWTTQAGDLSRGDLADALDRWSAYYSDLAIDRIGTGAVVVHRPLRRPGGQVWADEMAIGPDRPAGNQIRRAFEHRARGIATRDLLDTVVAPVDGMVVEQTLERQDGEYRPAALSVGLRAGLGMTVPVAPEVLAAVLALDGDRTVRSLIASAGATDATPSVLETLARLLDLGIAALVSWRVDIGSCQARRTTSRRRWPSTT